MSFTTIKKCMKPSGSCCSWILKLTVDSFSCFVFCLLFSSSYFSPLSAGAGEGAGASCYSSRHHERPRLRQQHRHLCHHQTRSGLHQTVPGVPVQRQEVRMYQYDLVYHLKRKQKLKNEQFIT